MRESVCLVLQTASVPWRVAESVLVLRTTSEQRWKNLTILVHVRLIIITCEVCDRVIEYSVCQCCLFVNQNESCYLPHE